MTTYHLSPSLLISLSIGLYTCASGAVAQTNSSTALIEMDLEQLLQTSIVTPNQSASISELPVSATTITAQQIREKNYRTLPQSLEETAGIWVQKTAYGQGSPFLRGFTGFRNLFLIDGVRLNNAVFREGPNQYWNTVDAWSVESIEVAFGPFSTQWGSDAVGGTVQAKSLSQQAMRNTSEISGALQPRYSSADESFVIRAETRLAGSGFGFVAGATSRNYSDLSGGRNVGEQPNTGYDEVDADAKLEWALRDNIQLVWAIQNVRQIDVPRTHRTVNGISWKGTSVGSDLQRNLDQERTLTYVQLHATELAGYFDEAHLSVSLHRQEEQRDLLRSGGDRRVSGFTDDQSGLYAHLIKNLPSGTINLGLDHYHDDVDSFEDRWDAAGNFTGSRIQGPVGDDASYDLTGLFAQYSHNFTKQTITAGLRATRARGSADRVANQGPGPAVISVSKKWSSFDGSVRWIYRLNGTRSLWAGVSTAFRAPNLSDLTRLDFAQSNEFETPSTTVEPEKFRIVESGYKWSTDRSYGSISVYYTDVEDLIRRFRTGVVDPSGNFEVQKANIGDGYVVGFEANASVTLSPSWTVFGGIGYSRSEVDNLSDSGDIVISEPLGKSPPLMGVLGSRWELRRFDSWLELTAKAAADADRLAAADSRDVTRIPPGGTPSFSVFSLRGGMKVGPHVAIMGAVENLFDEDYRYHGSGSNEAGMNFVVTLRADF